MIVPPAEAGAEEVVGNLVMWLKLGLEAVGALIIGLGMLLSARRFARASFPPTARDFTDGRLVFARFLSLALEFQLGADVLSTAVAPSWDAIGKLAAIAVIRTALNFFLGREMRDSEHDPVGP
jgi:uncharacterized membrane protein